MPDQSACDVRRVFLKHAERRRCGVFSPCQICSAPDPLAAAKRLADQECLYRRRRRPPPVPGPKLPVL